MNKDLINLILEVLASPSCTYEDVKENRTTYRRHDSACKKCLLIEKLREMKADYDWDSV